MEVLNNPRNEALLDQVEQLTEATLSFVLDEEVLGSTDEVVISPNMRTFITRPDGTLATLVDGNTLLGYNYAIPIDVMNPDRVGEGQETAYIYLTAIQPARQGEGLVRELNERTFVLLKEKGYSFVEIDAMHKSGYADMLSKSYVHAIVAKRDHDDWGLGWERFFRIDLALAASQASPELH